MPMPFTHTLKRSKRSIMAASLMLIYLMILLGPLASLAMNSKTVAHAMTGECTGDCNLCGCSPESRASNTCCCSKKRQQRAHAHEDEDEEDGVADCCKKRPVQRKTVFACGCPCGGGKQGALTATEELEVIPLHFREQFNIPSTVTSFAHQQHRLISRHNEPPDPPPRLG